MRSSRRWPAAFVCVPLLAACSVWSPPLLAPTPVDASPFDPVVQRYSASVGRLLSTSCTGAPFAGSGFVVGPGLVLTAAHVVDGARQVSVRLAGAEPVPAEVIGIDPNRDTALVRTEFDPAGAPVIALAADATEVGSAVVALGYPLGESRWHREDARITSVTDSAIVNGAAMHDLLTVDATLPIGMSGGPVLDARGVARGMAVAAIGGRGGRDSTSPVALGIPAARLAGSFAEWRNEPPVRSAPCAGEVDRGGTGGPDLVVTSSDPDAPELAHTLWLLGRSINAGQYPGAAGLLTSSLLTNEGGAATWAAGLGQTRWLGIDVAEAGMDGDRASARARLRTTSGEGCRVQQVDYRFVRAAGIWRVDAIEPVGAAQAC